MAADATGGVTADATAELWIGAGSSVAPAACLICAYDERQEHGGEEHCGTLVERLVPSLVPTGHRRVALLLGSLLADAGRVLFSGQQPQEPEPSLEGVVHRLGRRGDIAEAFVFTGSTGAHMTALAFAQDLLSLDRADVAVVCGVDLVGGPFSQGLRLLGCEDLPSLSGGGHALLLERPGQEQPHHPTLRSCALVGPEIPPRPTTPMDLTGVSAGHGGNGFPVTVGLSGVSSLDLSRAEQLATHVWPGTSIRRRTGLRSVGADVLLLVSAVGSEDPPLGIAAVHPLGGTGHCLIT
ncbi:hypothetical protein ACL02U_27230 [Streptomyces sp. MS06]|uniref:hypothetical protein n=1 Tax=Streptomyces sp. MS06 TaxID=3385974 RepID=UPI00399FBB63